MEEVKLYLKQRYEPPSELDYRDGRTITYFDCLCGDDYPVGKNEEVINVKDDVVRCRKCGRIYQYTKEYVTPIDNKFQCYDCHKLVDKLYKPFTYTKTDYDENPTLKKSNDFNRKYNMPLCFTCLNIHIDWLKETITMAKYFIRNRIKMIDILLEEVK